MALPAAPLGSMPSLNVPTHIPKSVHSKQPKLWQQALASILTQAAGQAVGQGVGNVMERDYAAEYGGEEATGWDAFAKGPKVSEKDHLQRQSAKTQQEMLLADLTAKLGTRELDNMSAQDAQRASRHERELSAFDRRQGDREQIIAQSKLSRRESGEKAALQDQSQDATRTLQQQNAEQARELAILRAQMDAASPTSVANARNQAAQAAGQENVNIITGQMADKVRGKAAGPQASTGTPPPTSGMRAYAQGTTPQPETPDPQLQAVMQQLERTMATQPQSAGDPTMSALRGAGPSQQDVLRRVMEQILLGQGQTLPTQ